VGEFKLHYCKKKKGKEKGAANQARWLTLVILATQEADIKRIAIQGQQNIHEPPSQPVRGRAL
jgi:hypothetical protein